MGIDPRTLRMPGRTMSGSHRLGSPYVHPTRSRLRGGLLCNADGSVESVGREAGRYTHTAPLVDRAWDAAYLRRKIIFCFCFSFFVVVLLFFCFHFSSLARCVVLCSYPVRWNFTCSRLELICDYFYFLVFLCLAVFDHIISPKYLSRIRSQDGHWVY